MNKLLIVDGMNLLFQMFYGMPSRIINKDGKAIQGTLGFIGALKKILTICEPTHLVILFDGEHPTFRSEILKEYKQNRPDYSKVCDDENPFSQLNDVYNALDYLKIKHTEVLEYETDDVISSYVFTYQEYTKIIISSFDSDFFQLINSSVSILRYRGKNTTITDEDCFINKFHIKPNQYTDYKSLVGDSADNIKGCPGIGPKTATKLLQQYNDIDTLYNNINDLKESSIKKQLLINKEKIYTNQILIKLSNEAPLPYLLNDLKYNPINESTNQILTNIGLK